MDAIPPPPLSVMQVADRTEREIRNADRTVREVIPPWHVLKDKLDAKAAEKASAEQVIDDADVIADVEDAPPSGVRMSDPGPPPAPQGPASDAPLTYKVYTLAELERRSDAPVSLRASRLAFDVTAARGPSHFVRVRTAVVAFAVAVKDWIKIQGQRPHPFVALRQPFDTLGDELQAWVQAIDWKKVGITTGTAVGAGLALLFAVLTVAELTDDLKPTASARLAATDNVVGPPPPPAAASALPVVNAASAMQAPAAADADSVIEVDEPADAPEGREKKAKKPAAHRPKTNKLTFRNANEIFNP